MSIRKISIILILLLLLAIVAYYRNSIAIYDAYVNSYILKTFAQFFPDLDLKISSTVVVQKNNNYKISLSGILIKQKDGKLVGKIPRINATVGFKYFFLQFTIKDLEVIQPNINLPSIKGYSFNTNDIINYTEKHLNEAKITNISVNGIYINEIYFNSKSQYNKYITNINIKKDHNTSLQLEARTGNYITLSSQFANLDLSEIDILPDKYHIIASGHSTFTLDKAGQIITGNIKIKNITGKINGNISTDDNITSGNGIIEIKQKILIIKELNFFKQENKTSLSGEYSLQNHSMNLSVKTELLHARELLEFWPTNIEKESRNWFETHVQDGNLISPEIKIKGSFINEINIDVESDFIDGKLEIEELFAPIINLSGHLSIKNQKLDIFCKSGKLDNIKLTNGVIKKDNIDSDNPIIIHGTSHSSLKNLYPLINEKNIKKEIDGVDGDADSEFFFKIGDSIEKRINLRISNAHNKKFLKRFNLQKGVFKLDINNDNWKLYGDAFVNEKNFTLTSDNTEGIINTHFTGKIAVSNLLDLGLLNIDYVSGEANINIYSTSLDDYQYINGEVDISDTIINIESIGWYSKLGDSGSLKFNAIKNDKLITIPNLSINSDKVTIYGTGSIEEGTIKHITLNKALVNNNNIQLNYKYTNGVKKITIKGDKLVAIQLEGKNFKIEKNLELIVSLKELRLSNDIPIFDFNLKVGTEYKNTYMSGKFDDERGFVMENNHDGLTIHSNDAGLILAAFGVTDNVKQGELLLHSQSGNNKGNLIIKDFFLIKAPVLTQILSLASLQGVVNTLNNEGIYFNQLKAPFTFKNNIATFDESWMEGISLGISFEGPVNIQSRKVNLFGYVVPLYYINKLIWKTPLIGHLLTGGKGRGVISADYKLQTQEDGENKVSVNLISILTPKILQRVLEIF